MDLYENKIIWPSNLQIMSSYIIISHMSSCYTFHMAYERIQNYCTLTTITITFCVHKTFTDHVVFPQSMSCRTCGTWSEPRQGNGGVKESTMHYDHKAFHTIVLSAIKTIYSVPCECFVETAMRGKFPSIIKTND